jgi:hypothetical protein
VVAKVDTRKEENVTTSHSPEEIALMDRAAAIIFGTLMAKEFTAVCGLEQKVRQQYAVDSYRYAAILLDARRKAQQDWQEM